MGISLASIAKTRHATPPRMIIHGLPKGGKSTFFAGGMEAGGGYGVGYVEAMNYWRVFLGRLNYLNRQLGMLVGIICHSSVVKFNDPMAEPYDVYQLKLHTPSKGTGAGNLLQEWADVIGFVSKQVLVTNKETDQKPIMRGTEIKAAGGVPATHQLHLVGSPAYLAGNRYSLPPTINLNWAAFDAAMAKTNNQQQAKGK